ncbi:MAG: hypothetical protein J0G36_09740 [Afipia sp.]|nr:hypothetical protein [Afipia sp.]
MNAVRSLNWSGWARVCAAAICLALPGPATLGGTIGASATLEERKLPMTFKWHDAQVSCERDCAGWIGAVGVITSDTPAKFEEFAKDRKLKGAMVVLDSSGGSVLDAIALGRRWRGLGLRTTVGLVISSDERRDVLPDAYCESMCAFLLLSGSTRTVPDGARVRVHQIWMGDRADDAKAATYSADDLMIVERDIGRLAKYTFDMGGTGDLLSLALSVPPWEPLHQLTADELRLTNLVTQTAMADAKPPSDEVVGSSAPKVQDRVVSVPEISLISDIAGKDSRRAPGTKTAEAHAPTGGAAPAAAER